MNVFFFISQFVWKQISKLDSTAKMMLGSLDQLVWGEGGKYFWREKPNIRYQNIFTRLHMKISTSEMKTLQSNLFYFVPFGWADEIYEP